MSEKFCKKNIAQIHVSKHFQKIIKNISKMNLEKFFLQLLLFLFEETFCIKKFRFSIRGKKLKIRFKSRFTQIRPFQYILNGLLNVFYHSNGI